MEKAELIERAKMYLQKLGEGIHPVTGEQIPNASVFMDEKVKRCFSFITEVLSDYVELTKENEQLRENAVVVTKKQEFNVTQAQVDQIMVSKLPVTSLTLMKNINSVINPETTEKLSSSRLNKWLVDKGILTTTKVKTEINKTVYKPSELAKDIGIVEETVGDRSMGAVKQQIVFGEAAQLFILENISEIISQQNSWSRTRRWSGARFSALPLVSVFLSPTTSNPSALHPFIRVHPCF